jgi:hypothetical protein
MSPVPNHSRNQRKPATSKTLGKIEEAKIDIQQNSGAQVSKGRYKNNGKPLLSKKRKRDNLDTWDLHPVSAFGLSMAAKFRNLKRREEQEAVWKEKVTRAAEARVQRQRRKEQNLRKKEEEGAPGLGWVDYVGDWHADTSGPTTNLSHIAPQLDTNAMHMAPPVEF